MAGKNVRKRNNASKAKQEEKEINKKTKEKKESRDSKTSSKRFYLYIICAISVFVLSYFRGTITKSFNNFQNRIFEGPNEIEEVYYSNEYLSDEFILEKRYF